MKKKLRKKLIEKRNKLSLKKVRLDSQKIKEELFKSACFKDAQKIGIYFSKDNEVLTEKIINELLKSGKIVFLPRIKKGNKNQELELCKIKRFSDLKKGSYGIMEPKASCQAVNLEELDLIIMPCVGLDEKGNRLGRGAGMYDKLLSKHKKVKTACLAYDFQVLPSLPAEKHDQQTDFIITEKRTIITGIREAVNKNKINNKINKKDNLLDGKKLSREILNDKKRKIKSKEITLKLAVILIGNNPASEVYVREKKKACNEAGIGFEIVRMKKNASQNKVMSAIKKLNNSKKVTGIMVQLPLPAKFDADKVINSVLPEKDVDGLTSANMEKLAKGDEALGCCTPKAIIKILESYKIDLNNRRIVLVGYGKLVGKPLSIMLKNRNLAFRVCDDQTKNLENETQKADILITATGQPHLITARHVKKGAVVIDAGTSKLSDRIAGDVDFDNVKDKAGWITPVPGGVGPMTVAMLITNLVNAYFLQKKKDASERSFKKFKGDKI